VKVFTILYPTLVHHKRLQIHTSSQSVMCHSDLCGHEPYSENDN
jgi:hypothetical protein